MNSTGNRDETSGPASPASPVCYADEAESGYMFADGPPVRIKRIYEPPGEADGRRVLVDRLWPRGLSREKASLDLWLKEVAPSHELRRWYKHETARWPEFQKRYRAELADRSVEVEQLVSMAREGGLTLLFSARDEQRNQAAVLRDLVIERLYNRTD